jgi:2-polyprenyl-6-methoxyphenol hydroxylase-like FAD-dependent oxidoreductase
VDFMASDGISVRCCIAGGGPAGLMLGFLLARAGVDVLVLEKHKDFLRDFRGDTIHPSTLELMHELGLAEELLKLPHEKVHTLAFHAGSETLPIADFSHLPVRHPFIAIMPQWDFLNFIAAKAGRYPGFNLLMEVEAAGLIERDGRVTGMRAHSPTGDFEVTADLVIAADGRDSRLRTQAGLDLRDIGAPMDVLWFRLSRATGDPPETMARLGAGEFMVMINRGDYWQCGFVIPKGTAEEVRRRGVGAFRHEVAKLAPFADGRVSELRDWEQIKLLTVSANRLVQWYKPGFLCIGDAAHAMSPVGGVGINLAIQDAVAAANILSEPLRDRAVTLEHLRRVQHRRELPTRITQLVQTFIQNRVLSPILRSKQAPEPPFILRLLARFPRLRRIPAHVAGIGFRPEHVRLEPVAEPKSRGRSRARAQKKA